MRVKVSESIGFCYGVKKAVNTSRKVLAGGEKRIFSIGPLIHNPQVVEELYKKGLTPVDSLCGIKSGTIIISSHGAGAKLKDRGLKGKLKVVDATCPFVKKIQGYVKELHMNGYKIVIVGKKEHPEVKGLIEFTCGRGSVIKGAAEARRIRLDRSSRVGVVAQSTYQQSAFKEVVSVLLKKTFAELRVFNTICSDTIKRQEDIRRLTGSVDAVIVIGGRNSSNTRRLVEICRKQKKSVYHIEDSAEIDPLWLKGAESVGIASGASTPERVVCKIIERIRRYC